jgi:phosphate:Na+ symporter
MGIVTIIFSLVGSIGFLLYGMKMMSDGIQKSAGQNLHRTLSLMTNNRVLAVITGAFITAIIQSSSATTVMVVSFVNAGLFTLEQSIGVIFGANIGTTITAWIVSLFGFKFKIGALAVPLFGIGFIISETKRIRAKNIGEALMGFGLLFLGLDLLTAAIPNLTVDDMSFLAAFTDRGVLSLLAGIVAGVVATIVIHASSATTAIILTMSYKGLLTWEFAAAMILGSNIGTTIDAVIASIGTKVNARRAALVHVLFNITGTIIAALFFHPLLALVDFIVPGPVDASITTHIAALHTVFNLLCTLVFLPLTKPIARITERLIPREKDETPGAYRFEFVAAGLRDNAEARIIRAEKEVADFAEVATRMFLKIRDGLQNRTARVINSDYTAWFVENENYADAMREEISRFLVRCLELPMSDRQKSNISVMLRIVGELENMTDDCLNVAFMLSRSVEKNMNFAQEDIDRLVPYSALAEEFLVFISDNINKRLTNEQHEQAISLENRIDAFRKDLKKVARKRLEHGADVKAELLYIDLVRNIEKIGDRAFSISESLAETR